MLKPIKWILTPITNDLVKISEEFTPVTPDPKIIPSTNIVIIAKKNEQGGGFKEIKYGEIDDATFFEISSKNAYNSLETGKANAELNASTTNKVLNLTGVRSKQFNPEKIK